MEKQNLELINRRIKDTAETLCEDWAGRDLFSGVCMVKCKGHTVFSKAYGFANRAFKIPNTTLQLIKTTTLLFNQPF